MARALNFRHFQALLGEVKAQYETILMYNNVQWLSRGRVLEKFVACLNEIRLFMYEKKHKTTKTRKNSGKDVPRYKSV